MPDLLDAVLLLPQPPSLRIRTRGRPLPSAPAAPGSPAGTTPAVPARSARHAHGLASGSKVPCSTCHLLPGCLPAGLAAGELDQVDRVLVTSLRKVAQGETLFRRGNAFDAVYPVWTGFFKTVVATRQGNEQVTGYQMGGDLLGLDGIDTALHGVDAVALEDSQVCVVPYGNLESLGREMPGLLSHLHKAMSREIGNDHGAMLRLGSMHAEERVAEFLLGLSHRLRRQGFSASSLVLRMSREEIGSYLGLKLETVSRTLSKLHASGLLFVCQRKIQITDPVGLQHLLDGVAVPARSPMAA